jgi:hypothetical protein
MIHLLVHNQWPKGVETVNTIWCFDFTILSIFLFLFALGIGLFLFYFKRRNRK